MSTRFDDGPATSPGFQLWRVTLTWQRRMAAALTPYGLTHTQFVLLACTWWLGRADALPTQTDLTRQAGTDVRTTSQVLKTLERGGLVARVSHPHDSRARGVSLTDAGRALVARVVGAVEDADVAFFGASADAARDVLRTLPGALAPAGEPVGARR